jgi:simple sugar transport system permease protein
MFTKDMVAGRGFIALAAEAMGHGNPLVCAVCVLFFGLADALSNNLQILNLSSELMRLIPYVFTLIMLAVYALQEKKKKG